MTLADALWPPLALLAIALGLRRFPGMPAALAAVLLAACVSQCVLVVWVRAGLANVLPGDAIESPAVLAAVVLCSGAVVLGWFAWRQPGRRGRLLVFGLVSLLPLWFWSGYTVIAAACSHHAGGC